jgi:hypothetical protein
MLRTRQHSSEGGTVGAAFGGIAFSVLTLVAVTIANSPGGNYSASQIADYLARGHRVAVIVVFHLALLGLLGLIAVLAHVRDLLPDRRNATIIWGTGVAAAACFAIGWGIVGGQVIAHLEGGNAIAVSPAVTYLISEIGAVFIFGCGAILLGLALIVLMLNSSTVLPRWLRSLTLVCGIAGVAGLAFFTFFVLMLWGLAIGLWLATAGRHIASPGAAMEAHA